MKKIISMLLCLFMVVSVFAACDNDSGTSSTDPSVSKTESNVSNDDTSATESTAVSETENQNEFSTKLDIPKNCKAGEQVEVVLTLNSIPAETYFVYAEIELGGFDVELVNNRAVKNYEVRNGDANAYDFAYLEDGTIFLVLDGTEGKTLSAGMEIVFKVTVQKDIAQAYARIGAGTTRSIFSDSTEMYSDPHLVRSTVSNG